jgi:hypothetical protein
MTAITASTELTELSPIPKPLSVQLIFKRRIVTKSKPKTTRLKDYDVESFFDQITTGTPCLFFAQVGQGSAPFFWFP